MANVGFNIGQINPTPTKVEAQPNKNIILNETIPSGSSDYSELINTGSLAFFDQSLLASLNYIGGSIYYYKVDPQKTRTNIYGEALIKTYYSPVHCQAFYKRSERSFKQFHGTSIQTIDASLQVSIPRILCEQVGILPEVGDIIFDYERSQQYFEVNTSDNVYLQLNNVNVPGEGSEILNKNNKSQLSIFDLKCSLTNATRLGLTPYPEQ